MSVGNQDAIDDVDDAVVGHDVCLEHLGPVHGHAAFNYVSRTK